MKNILCVLLGLLGIVACSTQEESFAERVAGRSAGSSAVFNADGTTLSMTTAGFQIGVIADPAITGGTNFSSRIISNTASNPIFRLSSSSDSDTALYSQPITVQIVAPPGATTTNTFQNVIEVKTVDGRRTTFRRLPVTFEGLRDRLPELYRTANSALSATEGQPQTTVTMTYN